MSKRTNEGIISITGPWVDGQHLGIPMGTTDFFFFFFFFFFFNRNKMLAGARCIHMTLLPKPVMEIQFHVHAHKGRLPGNNHAVLGGLNYKCYFVTWDNYIHALKSMLFCR